MKRYIHIVMLIVVFVTLFAGAAKAQTSGPQRLIANIPFAFTAGKTNFPAGKYTFTVLNQASDRKALQIRSADGHTSALILTSTVDGMLSENAKLVFERYGDHYSFTQAQLAGEATSLAALRSSSERKDMLARGAKKTVIVITIG